MRKKLESVGRIVLIICLIAFEAVVVYIDYVVAG